VPVSLEAGDIPCQLNLAATPLVMYLKVNTDLDLTVVSMIYLRLMDSSRRQQVMQSWWNSDLILNLHQSSKVKWL